jgi:ABC-2 type transport system permease protein
MNTMKWLIKREFWEHKGGFFWAPLVVGALISILIALPAFYFAAKGDDLQVRINGEMRSGGEAVKQFSQKMTPEQMTMATDVAASSYMGFAGPLAGLLGFVLFFFCLNALFDERKDRSVLFWKSLPVSDTETVLSKVAMALAAAPLVTLAFAIASALISVLAVTLSASMVGVGSLSGLLGTPAFYYSPLLVAAMLPVFAVWALPAVGWLLMVGAWAKSKPFIWAAGVPLLVGGLIAWIDKMFALGWDTGWFWKNIVARMLLSVVPGSWFGLNSLDGSFKAGITQSDVTSMLSQSWQQFAHINIWIGAIAGAAMIYIAIRLRRWRDEG